MAVNTNNTKPGCVPTPLGPRLVLIRSPTRPPRRVVQFASMDPYLQGHLELGRSLGVPRGLVGGSLNVHRHGKDRRVDRARLGQQAVLKARVDLVQAHQSVHGVVWISHPPVQD